MFKYKANTQFNFGDNISNILKYKGITNINEFINPTDKNIEDLFVLDNIKLAVQIYAKHVINQNRIGIVVDPDVDGFTSSSLIYQYTKRVFPNVDIVIYIHNSKEHGLEDLMDDILSSCADLIICPDCATNDYNECKKLKSFGRDIIILDHHTLSSNTIKKYGNDIFNQAIIVNNQLSNRCSDKSMSGVGIVYKFIKLCDKYMKLHIADEYLDLVALGLVADRSDLHNLQSRYYVYKGIEQINNKENKNILIKKIFEKEKFMLNKKVDINGLGFSFAPYINSLIRFGTYEEKYDLFLALSNDTRNIHKKLKYIGEINCSIQDYIIKISNSYRNKQRKKVKQYVEILDKEIEEYKLDSLAIIVCKIDSSIEKELTGLMANKIMSKYRRPVLLLRENEKTYSGSFRGYELGNIKDTYSWCENSNLFLSCDGHPNAGGVTIYKNKINDLYSLISTIPYDNVIIYNVDFELNDKTITKELILELNKYDFLWGCGIDKPTFALTNICINKSNIKLIGKDLNTIKFNFHNIEFMIFNVNAESYNKILCCGENIKFTLVGEFNINKYNNDNIAQVIINDYMFEPCANKNVFRFGN